MSYLADQKEAIKVDIQILANDVQSIVLDETNNIIISSINTSSYVNIRPQKKLKIDLLQCIVDKLEVCGTNCLVSQMPSVPSRNF